MILFRNWVVIVRFSSRSTPLDFGDSGPASLRDSSRIHAVDRSVLEIDGCLIDGKESRVQYNTVFDVADMLLSSPFKGSTLHRDTRRSWYQALVRKMSRVSYKHIIITYDENEVEWQIYDTSRD